MAESERLNELEIRLAYLEDSLATLDDVITQQSGYISRLEAGHKGLVERIKTLQARFDESGGTSHEPPPPHY